jgi:flagellar motor switch protein FliN
MQPELTKPVATHSIGAGPATAFSSIPVTVSVMLGTATLPLSDILQFQPGSELVLDQSIGDPVIVIVNGTKVARGELYVLEAQSEQLGVRITEILSIQSQ